MLRCLSEFEIDGVMTNIEYQKKIISNPHFRSGEISTAFISRMNSTGGN